MDEGKAIEKETYTAEGPTVFSCNLSVGGSKYIWTHSFQNGSHVPVYEVETVHALNQLIGHAKFNNRAYGNVFYRGECKLHDSLRPALYRSRTKIDTMNSKILRLIRKIAEDEQMKRDLKIENPEAKTEIYKIEGMLQH